VGCAKTAEPIDLPFWLWSRGSRVGRRMHKFNRIRQVAPLCNHGRTHCRHLANTIEQSVYGDDADLCYITLTSYLLSWIYTHSNNRTDSERFEPNTVLWALHTIQPSSCCCCCCCCCYTDAAVERGIVSEELLTLFVDREQFVRWRCQFARNGQALHAFAVITIMHAIHTETKFIDIILYYPSISF